MRAAFNRFVERHDVAWELGMGVLAIAYVLVGFAADDPAAQGLAQPIEAGLTTIFVAEFVVRFAASFDRGAYLRGHWIDLVALIPTVRQFRVLRVLRLLRLVRTFAGIYRAEHLCLSAMRPLQLDKASQVPVGEGAAIDRAAARLSRASAPGSGIRAGLCHRFFTRSERELAPSRSSNVSRRMSDRTLKSMPYFSSMVPTCVSPRF